MKKRKQIFAQILVLVMVLTLIQPVAMAAETSSPDEIVLGEDSNINLSESNADEHDEATDGSFDIGTEDNTSSFADMQVTNDYTEYSMAVSEMNQKLTNEIFANESMEKLAESKLLVHTTSAIHLGEYTPVMMVKGPNYHYTIQYPDVETAKKAMDWLLKQENTVYAEQDNIVELPDTPSMEESGIHWTPFTSYASGTSNSHMSWGMSHLGVDEYAAYVKTKTTSGITVAVIDTGVSKNNPYFSGKLVAGYDFYDDDSDPDDYEAGNCHGTHVAGTIIDGTPGLNVKIMPVRVLGPNGGYNSDVANGVIYAADHGAKVLNMSLGGTHSSMLDEAIQYAYEKGCTLVIASGNESADVDDTSSPVCPAHCSDYAIIVGALDQTEQVTDFSNYGTSLDVIAPGYNIVSCSYTGTNAQKSGTSMATPHVAALAAMIKLANPGYTPAKVEQTLKSVCRDLGPSGYDIDYGYGIPDLRSLINKPLYSGGPTATAPKPVTITDYPEYWSSYDAEYISWNAVSGAEYYILYLKDAISGKPLKQVDVDTTSFAIINYPSTKYIDTYPFRDGTTYYWQVAAIKSDDTYTLSPIYVKVYGSGDSYEFKDVPAKPTGLVGESLTGGIQLSWNPVNTATSYNVYRKVSGGSYSKIGTSTDGTYYDQNVTAGTSYIYAVTAVNSFGESAKSAAVEVKYQIKLEVPTGLSAQNTTDGIYLTWNNVPFADGYYVYRKVNGESSYTKIGTTAESKFLCYHDDDVKDGTTYYYYLRAFKGTIVSASTSSVKITCLTSLDAATGLKATNTVDGIKLKWNAVKKAESYYVLRSDGSTTSELYHGSDTEFIDTKAKHGCTYTYSVVAFNGGVFGEYANIEKTCVFHMDAPADLTATNTTAGMVLKWARVDHAVQYNVYRKVAGSTAFEKIANVAAPTFKDTTAESGKNYYYYITAVNGSISSKRSNEVHLLCVTTMAAPSGITLENTSKGISVSWKAASNATQYQIYRKLSTETEYTRIKTMTGTSFIDTTVEIGKTYNYKLKAVNGSVISSYSSIISLRHITALKAPADFKANNTASGVELSWNAVNDAKEYAVWRRLASETTYTEIARITTTSFKDTSAAAGQTYRYTIKAVNGQILSSGSTPIELVVLRTLSAPTGLSASNTGSGVKLTWSTLKNATGYYVYRRPAGSSDTFTQIGKTTTTEYIDSTVTSGSYEYTLKSYNGSVKSVYSSKASLKVVRSLSIPGNVTASNNTNGIRIEWNSVANAEGYYVYRKLSTEASFTKIATRATTYDILDKDVVAGKTYIYKVVAYNGSVKANSAEVTIKCVKSLSAPTTIAAINTKSGVKISFSTVTNAAKYEIYRKTGSGSYSLLTTTTKTSYTDKSAVSGTSYSYYIKCINGTVKSANSTSKTMKCITALNAPKTVTPKNTPDGIMITWDKVTSAEGYNILRAKTGEDNYTLIGKVTGTAFTDTTAVNGTSYRYRIQPFNGSVLGSTLTAASIKCCKSLSAPTELSAKNSTTAVTLTWKSVSNATGYKIYRRLSTDTSYTQIATRTSCSFNDTTAVHGKTYLYKIVAYNGTVIAYSSPLTIKCVKELITPEKLTVSKKSNGLVLSWESVLNATGYKVYRRLSTETTFTLLGQRESASFTDTTAKTGLTYIYKVIAWNDSVFSPGAIAKYEYK